MRVKVILNPYANRWGAKARAEATADAFRAAGVECDLTITDAPGGGTPLAEAAARQGYDAVIAAGGELGTDQRADEWSLTNGSLVTTGEAWEVEARIARSWQGGGIDPAEVEARRAAVIARGRSQL